MFTSSTEALSGPWELAALLSLDRRLSALLAKISALLPVGGRQHDSDLLEWPGFWRAWECVCAGGRGDGGIQDFVNGVQICERCRHDMLGGNLTSPLDLPQHKIKRIWALINFVFRNLITSLAAVECCCWLMRMTILLFLYSQYGKFNSCHGNSRHKYSFPSLGLCFF